MWGDIHAMRTDSGRRPWQQYRRLDPGVDPKKKLYHYDHNYTVDNNSNDDDNNDDLKLGLS